MHLPRSSLRKIYQTSTGTICSQRLQSSLSSPSYHPKVRALPFAITAEDAIQKLSLDVAVGSGSSSAIARAVLARWLPAVGVQPIRPAEIMATYMPVWFVDADVQGKLHPLTAGSSSEGSQHTSSLGPIVFQQAYMPGFATEPLCRMSMKNAGQHMALSVPWTESLRRQHNLDVSCPPFTLTPLSVVDAARHFLETNTILHRARLDPRSLQLSFIAVYPVLVPIYMARYSIRYAPNENIQVFAVLEASSEEGSSGYVVNPEAQIENARHRMGSMRRWMPKLPELLPTHLTGNAFSSSLLTGTVPGLDARMRALESLLVDQWINERLREEGIFKTYEKFESGLRSSAQVNFDDARMRQWTEEEVSATESYLDIQIILRTHEGRPIPEAAQQRIADAISKGTMKNEDQQARLKDLSREDLVELGKPDWFRSWESGSKGLHE